MKNCPHCNAQIGDTASFCVHCMTSLEEKNSIGAIKNKNKGWLILIAAILVLVLIFLSSVVFLLSSLINDFKKEAATSSSQTSSYHQKNYSSNKTEESSINILKHTQNGNEHYVWSDSYSSYVGSNPTYTFTVENGQATITNASSNIRGDVVLPEMLCGYRVVSIADNAFENVKSIISITIPACVAHIGEHAFYGCDALTTVKIKANVSTIEYSCFEECTSLQSVYIPVSVKNVEACAFDFCKSITDVYYEGSEEQKNNIMISQELGALQIYEGNAYLQNACWHYNVSF